MNQINWSNILKNVDKKTRSELLDELNKLTFKDLTQDDIFKLGAKHMKAMMLNGGYKPTYELIFTGDDRGEFLLRGGIVNDPNGLQFESSISTETNLELDLLTHLNDNMECATDSYDTREDIARSIGELMFLIRAIIKKYPTTQDMLDVAYRNDGEIC